MANQTIVGDDAALISPAGAAVPVPSSEATEILDLGNGVVLSLKTDALLIKDEALAKKKRVKICGIPIGRASDEFTIPYYNILWAEVLGNAVFVDFAAVAKKITHTSKLTFAIHDVAEATITQWVADLLDRAYGKALRCKRAKVLVNPHAGPGGADKIWDNEVRPLFEAARMTLDVSRTTYSGEAVSICEGLDINAYDVVIPCSGDGLPHEVFNGLGKRPDAGRALRQLAVAHIPCGSGNAMSCNLNGSHRPSWAALAVIKGVRTPVDLISLTQGDRRTLSFLSQTLGIIAEADLGTEHLRWMGATRFDVGVGQRIFSKKTYPCDISVKVALSDKAAIKAHYKKELREADHTLRRDGTSTHPESVEPESSPGTAASGEGLPPLKYGTINDKVPADWETEAHEHLGNFYCGNMAWMAPTANFFAAACPNDGLMDMVTNNANIGAWKYLDLMTSVEKGEFFDKPATSYRKVVAYRITPRANEGYISIDGERVSFEPFQAEVHQGLGTVLSRNGKYEAPGPAGWDAAAGDAPADDGGAAAKDEEETRNAEPL